MYEYRDRPAIGPADMPVIENLFAAGFDDIGWNYSAEMVATGVVEIAGAWRVSVSLYLREMHLKVCGEVPFPESFEDQDKSHVLSATLPWNVVVSEKYKDYDEEEAGDLVLLTKEWLRDFVRRQMAKLVTEEEVDHAH